MTRPPGYRIAWIDTMIVIQAIDWIATTAYLLTGAVSLRQVTTAAFLPVVFIGMLLWWRTRAPHRRAVLR